MISTKIILPVLGGAVAATMMLGAIPAIADTTLGVNATAAVTVTPSTGVDAQVKANAAARLPEVIARGDADIAARIDALNKLNTRVQGLKNESDAEKAGIATQVQTNIAGLTTLKAKIDADTDVAIARTDDQSIFTDYRVYALVVPQGWILAAADRVNTIGGLMTTLSAKLQTRISADQTAGKDVTALTAALSDMNAKISAAATASASASASITGLTPDQGDKTVAAANKAALVAARAQIKTATADLQAARKDVTTIVAGLKSLDAKASASTSVSGGQQ